MLNLFIIIKELKHFEGIERVESAVRITDHCLPSEEVSLLLVAEEVNVTEVAACLQDGKW